MYQKSRIAAIQMTLSPFSPLHDVNCMNRNLSQKRWLITGNTHLKSAISRHGNPIEIQSQCQRRGPVANVFRQFHSTEHANFQMYVNDRFS